MSGMSAIKSDLLRYGRGSGLSAFARTWFGIPGFRYTFVMRKVRYHRARRRPASWLLYPFYCLLLRHYGYKFGIDFSPAAEVGPGLYIGHFGGIFVSQFAKLGGNVNISQGVTIGTINRGPRAGTPRVGDRVWIGAHAVLVGNISIGDDALIAPGAFVNFNVGPSSVVIGNPGRVVSQKGSRDYINNLAPVPTGRAETVSIENPK